MSSSVVVRGTFLVIKPYSPGASYSRVNVSEFDEDKPIIAVR
jgi:hypothetical protein